MCTFVSMNNLNCCCQNGFALTIIFKIGTLKKLFTVLWHCKPALLTLCHLNMETQNVFFFVQVCYTK